MRRNYKFYIAKTREGSEFIHSQEQAYFVPTASRQYICDQLNEVKWNLADGEKWHIYENDWYTETFINKEIKKTAYRIMWNYC